MENTQGVGALKPIVSLPVVRNSVHAYCCVACLVARNKAYVARFISLLVFSTDVVHGLKKEVIFNS